jgi:siroheme synthase (precorrin-2 oxidase/ferrochelatase)
MKCQTCMHLVVCPNNNHMNFRCQFMFPNVVHREHVFILVTKVAQ